MSVTTSLDCWRHLALAAIVIASLQPNISKAAETGTLSVTVLDSDGNQIPCRAWIKRGGTTYFEPHKPHTVTPYHRDESFSCDGQFEIRLPSGSATLHIEKGKEWLSQSIPIAIQANNVTRKTVTLRSWIDLESRGYYSTDLHVHFGNNDPRILEQLGTADDLDVIPSFTYWLRGTEEKWEPRWPALSSQGQNHPSSGQLITLNNIEIERISSRAQPGGSIGASFLFNLNAPLSVESYNQHYPTDADLCLLARATSPHAVIDTDKPSWAETVVGAILGAYDTVQVCHNHYHRKQTLAGGWGMIGPLNPRENSLTKSNELFHRTNQHYYSFLNCGIRLGVSGGSAIGVMPVPAGFNRVYAKVDGPFTMQKFWQSIRVGRSFATSGPIILLEIASKQPGDHISYDSSRDSGLTITTTTHSVDKLTALEIVHNGRVIRQVTMQNKTPNPSFDLENTFRHYPTRSGWYAARLVYEAPEGHLRQAHSSPIYVTVDCKPTAFKEDARYMIQWIEQLNRIANSPKRFSNPSHHREILQTYQRANAAYQRVAQTAAAIWGD